MVDETTGQALASPGSRVIAHLVIRLADGTVVENTRADDKPMRTVLGTADVHPCIEDAMMGLVEGARTTVSLPAERAFGERDESATHTMARSTFPDDMALDIGLVVGFDSAMGQPVAGTIVELDEHQAQVDFNHPLAGRDVELDIELLTLLPPIEAAD
jgi:FKBP-type peptidyl-prolyl cis-trans isomerase SlpA